MISTPPPAGLELIVPGWLKARAERRAGFETWSP
jgi:hypothetical protein